MKQERPFIRNFIVALSSVIVTKLVFLAFNLKIFKFFMHFLTWLVILIDFILIVIALKLIFEWMKLDDVIDGVWVGVVIYCWLPLLTLPWIDNFWSALQNSTFFVIIGLAILLLGVKLRKRD